MQGRRGRRIFGLSVASASIAAALASPTFGVNLSFNAGQSSIIYLHDAEDADASGASPTHFRNVNVGGAQIPYGSAPGYQMGSAFVNQFGGAGTGSSQGKMGIGHIEDIRTATMTVQSLTFVSQNEVNTADPALKMDGNSMVRANFTLVWDATGVYGPNLVGRVSVPIKATIVGGGSAKVQLNDVNWEVDLASDATGYFDARPAFTGEKAFATPGTFTTTLSSNSLLLKNQAGTNLTLNSGDKFRLTGTLTFLADGNSPADIGFEFSEAQYSDEILPNNPLRYYRLNESATDLPPDPVPQAAAIDGLAAIDLGSDGLNGVYTGNVQPEARTANFTLGTAARFPVDVARFDPPSLQLDKIAGPTISGFGDVIVAPHSDSINFGNPAGGAPFTVEAWVSREDFIGFANDAEPFYASLVDKQDAEGNGWRLGINNNSLLLDGGIGGTDAVLPFPNPDDSFQLDEFYHIVAVAAGDGSVRFFVNGMSLSTDATPYSLLTNSIEDLFIGNDLNGFSPFPGIIDEVAIYGQMLSDEDILRHFQRGRENTDLLPLMGIEIDNTFVELPEPATATLGMLALAAGSMAFGRRRRR